MCFDGNLQMPILDGNGELLEKETIVYSIVAVLTLMHGTISTKTHDKFYEQLLGGGVAASLLSTSASTSLRMSERIASTLFNRQLPHPPCGQVLLGEEVCALRVTKAPSNKQTVTTEITHKFISTFVHRCKNEIFCREGH